jgi:uncharacterized protein YbaR (Trm112 family)
MKHESKSEIEARRKAYHARIAEARDKAVPEIKMDYGRMGHLLCRECNIRPVYEISAYAFSKGGSHHLLVCPSCKKAVWIVTD